MAKEISVQTLNTIEDVMRAGKDRYTDDNFASDSFFVRAFKNYPKNTDPEIVAMKICLVDTTNTTNLGRLLGAKDFKDKSGKIVHRKNFTLSDLVNKIVSMKDFDERVKNGDVTLVTDLIKWGMEHDLNATSFFSKYCLYHNYVAYRHDDYSIFDKVVKDNLGYYLTREEASALIPGVRFIGRKGKTEADIVATAVASQIENMRKTGNYEAYNELIGKILELRGITEKEVPYMRRKLDYLVWYTNRKD